MKQTIDADSRGVYVIAPTPFSDDGALDLDSAARMCEFYLERGATGMTILGIMGEAPKLTPDESLAFTRTVLDTLAERIPVVVGVSGPSLRLMADLTRQVMDIGAAGVMVAPMPTLRTDEAIARYYSEVVAALGPVPMCLQDYPQTLGVHFSLPVLIRIFREHPSICMFKHEDNPGLNKLSRFRAAGENEIGRRLSILVGNGGLFLPQELARGADGAMTGFAFPEMLRRVVDLHMEGKPDDAETLFDAYLPLVRYELQPGLGLAIRKHILARRGAIACAALRAPGPALTNADVAEIDRLWTRLRRRLAELGEPASD